MVWKLRKPDDTIPPGMLTPDYDKNCGQETLNLQQLPPAFHPGNSGALTQHPELEIAGQSNAYISNPFDPYYIGTMAAYGQPLMVPSNLYNTQDMRLPIALKMAQEPVYVNAKQYHGILRRRQSRAKAELEKKLIKIRKPYLHESRHQHALKRARGTGGRFAKKSDADALKGTGSSSSSVQNSYNTDGCNFRNRTNFVEMTNQSHTGNMGKGSSSSQKWGNVPSNHALAMQ